MIDLDYIKGLTLRDTDISQHIMLLYLLPVLISAQRIVELGAGQSSFALTAAASKTGGCVHSFDLTRGAICRLFPKGEGLLDHHPKFIFTAGNDLDPVYTKDIDFLFIDTSHTYEHTKLELDKWGERVRVGGIIAMHDTSIHWPECRKAMMEYIEANGYPAVHFPNQNGFSIIYKI